MKKYLILFAILIFLIMTCFSGCTDNSNNEDEPSWNVEGYSTDTSSFTTDCSAGYPSQQGLSLVKLNIKNTGEKTTTYVVDFGFETKEIIDTGIWVFPQAKEPFQSRLPNNIEIQYQKLVTLDSGESKWVTCSTQPYTNDCKILYEWCYEINPV